MSIFWIETEYLFPTAVKQLEPVNIILDIGCGIRPQNFIKPAIHICCEPFEQYIESLQNMVNTTYEPDRRYIIMKTTWAEILNIFPKKSIDTVFLVDVVEHLEKETALTLLKATESIVRRQIAIFTPLGFLPQEHPDGKDAWGLDGGAWQEHKSGWYPEDFDTSWDIYAAKKFHVTDNMGRPFETPYGALWAIKTMRENDEKRVILSKRQRIHFIVDKAIDFLKLRI